MQDLELQRRQLLTDHMEDFMKTIIALAVVVIVTAGLLGFTSSGHHMLSTLGFATACENNNC